MRNARSTITTSASSRYVFRRDLVAELRRKGHSWAQIARTTGASVGSVRRVLQSASLAVVGYFEIGQT
jgi:lambda repressor-like predicted transcriptional regulator